MIALLVAYVVVMSCLTFALGHWEPDARRARRLRRESRKHGLQFKARGSVFPIGHCATSEPDPRQPRAPFILVSDPKLAKRATGTVVPFPQNKPRGQV